MVQAAYMKDMPQVVDLKSFWKLYLLGIHRLSYDLANETKEKQKGKKDRFCFILWHINRFKLFNAKSSLYIYIKYIRFVNTFCW